MSTELEVPMVNTLGVDGPIHPNVRHRLDMDLDTVHVILDSMMELSDKVIEAEGDQYETTHLACALHSMAYRAGRILEHWTGTGYFGDSAERRIEPPRDKGRIAEEAQS